MRRDPSLIPLSHQHHNGLAMCVLTRRSLGEDTSPANIAKLAKRAVDRYEVELSNHFEIEERILFPAIRASIDDAGLVDELIAQHRELEALIEELRAAPTAQLLEQLCELLSRHIRREENELFQAAQERLPEATLRDLGIAIEAQVVRVCM